MNITDDKKTPIRLSAQIAPLNAENTKKTNLVLLQAARKSSSKQIFAKNVLSKMKRRESNMSMLSASPSF